MIAIEAECPHCNTLIRIGLQRYLESFTPGLLYIQCATCEGMIKTYIIACAEPLDPQEIRQTIRLVTDDG